MPRNPVPPPEARPAGVRAGRSAAERVAEAQRADAERRLEAVAHDEKAAQRRSTCFRKKAAEAKESLEEITRARSDKSEHKIKSKSTLERRTIDVQLSPGGVRGTRFVELCLTADKPFMRHICGLLSHNADAFGPPSCNCSGDDLYNFTFNKRTHYDRNQMSFERMCAHAHVPVWEALGEEAGLAVKARDRVVVSGRERAPSWRACVHTRHG